MTATILSAAIALATSAPAGSIEGHWMHPEQTVIIRLESCGNAVCGTVTWATERAQRDARKGVDKLIGAQLLTEFHRNTKGVWKGRIFVPDYNLRVTGKIQSLDANRLKVSGCALGGLLCRSQIWTRSDRPVATTD